MAKKCSHPTGYEAAMAENACIAEVGDTLLVVPRQFVLDASIMPASTPIRVLLSPAHMCQELNGHISDPSLVHPSKGSFGGCLDKCMVKKPRGIAWEVPRGQAEPLLEFLFGHVGGEGLPSIPVFSIPAPDFPRPVGQRYFDCHYTLALPVKTALFVQLYAGHLICINMLQNREGEALLRNAEIVDVEPPVEKLASFGFARLQAIYRLWRIGLNI